MKFVAIDGEFEQTDGKNVLAKVTLVDEEGLILLDTLVDPGTQITYSCERIHGINSAWLKGAPSIQSVQAFI